MSLTWELGITAKNSRDCLQLSNWLDSVGQTYVSSCYVDESADDEMLHDWLESCSWDALPDWPLSLYFQTKVELQQFYERFQSWQRGQNLEGAYQTKVQEISDMIWQDAWEAELTSFETQRFCIQIAGQPTLHSAKCRITIEALNAFGSGQHATTKASLLMLEKIPQGDSLLDVGTGTGILAIAAEKMSYTQVVATDIDPDAWQSAELNRQLNSASFQLVRASLPPTLESYDTIVCNILPPVLMQIMPELSLRMIPGKSWLIMAGIHQANAYLLFDKARELGLVQRQVAEERGWLALAFQREPAN